MSEPKSFLFVHDLVIEEILSHWDQLLDFQCQSSHPPVQDLGSRSPCHSRTRQRCYAGNTLVGICSISWYWYRIDALIHEELVYPHRAKWNDMMILVWSGTAESKEKSESLKTMIGAHLRQNRTPFCWKWLVLVHSSCATFQSAHRERQGDWEGVVRDEESDERCGVGRMEWSYQILQPIVFWYVWLVLAHSWCVTVQSARRGRQGDEMCVTRSPWQWRKGEAVE